MTETQNCGPVLGHWPGGSSAQPGTTTLASYPPAPNAVPSVITNKPQYDVFHVSLPF